MDHRRSHCGADIITAGIALADQIHLPAEGETSNPATAERGSQVLCQLRAASALSAQPIEFKDHPWLLHDPDDKISPAGPTIVIRMETNNIKGKTVGSSPNRKINPVGEGSTLSHSVLIQRE